MAVARQQPGVAGQSARLVILQVLQQTVRFHRFGRMTQHLLMERGHRPRGEELPLVRSDRHLVQTLEHLLGQVARQPLVVVALPCRPLAQRIDQQVLPPGVSFRRIARELIDLVQALVEASRIDGRCGERRRRACRPSGQSASRPGFVVPRQERSATDSGPGLRHGPSSAATGVSPASCSRC